MSPKTSRFTQGLTRLESVGGSAPRTPAAHAAPPEPVVIDKVTARAGRADRAGKVNIAGYFDPAVRKQLAMLAVEHDTDQVKLMAEALNLLFEKYGRSPIARA